MAAAAQAVVVVEGRTLVRVWIGMMDCWWRQLRSVLAGRQQVWRQRFVLRTALVIWEMGLAMTWSLQGKEHLLTHLGFPQSDWMQ